jgi:dephospho-CoA kinase
MNGVKSAQETDQMWSAELESVARILRQDEEWADVADSFALSGYPERSLHLAVFVEPFLGYLLTGKKTVESRFSAVRFPPYQRVSRGDVVLIKKSGGPVVGICEVGAAWFYELNPSTWGTIRREFADAICAETPDFWSSREHAGFASLMFISRVREFPGIDWPKRDRRGWVVLRERDSAPLFGDAMGSIALGFSGSIASGKSTLSEAVAAALGCNRVSFGLHMRAEAARRGLPDDRSTLQKIGEELVDHNAEALCAAVLAQADWAPGDSIVIDGVRHIAVSDCLKQLVSPSDFQLVHISADRSTRMLRIADRGVRSVNIDALDAHSTEIQVHNAIPNTAALRLSGAQPLASAIEAILKWVEERTS